MNQETNRSSQTSLLLRLLVGGYLVYLAWDLRTVIRDSAAFLIAVVVFGIAGAVLAGSSLVSLLRGSFGKDAARDAEHAPDCEE